MTYLVEQKTSITPAILRRLFDGCESALDEGTYPFPSGLTSSEKFYIMSQDFEHYAREHCAYTIKKSGYIVAAICGKNNGTVFQHQLFLAGQDKTGSRAYLYDAAFALSIAEFHRDRGDTATKKSLMAERSMVGYHKTIWQDADCTELTDNGDSFDLKGNALSNWTSTL